MQSKNSSPTAWSLKIGPDRLFRNVGNYQSTLRDISKSEDVIDTGVSLKSPNISLYLCDIWSVCMEDEHSCVAFEKLVRMSVYKARGEKQWDDEKSRLVGKLTFLLFEI